MKLRPGILLILSAIASLGLLAWRLIPTTKFAYDGDSIANLLAIRSIYETGLPITRPPSVSPHAISNAPFMLYWEYGTEAYLRSPFALFSEWGNYSWVIWSALGYALIAIFWLIFNYARPRAEPRVSEVAVSLFFVLMGSSVLVAMSFWFCRYYPFLVVGMPLVHFLCVRTWIARDQVRGSQATPIIAFLPAALHLTTGAYFAYWLAQTLRGTASRLLRKSGPGFSWVPVAQLLIPSGTAALLAYTWRSHMQLEPEWRFVPLKFLALVLSLPHDISWPDLFNQHYAKLVLAVLVLWAGARGLKTELERGLFRHGLGAIVGGVAIFSLAGAHQILFNVSRYLLFLVPIWFFVVALAIAGLARLASGRFVRKPIGVAAAAVIAIGGAYLFRQESMSYEYLQTLPQADVDRAARIYAERPNTVFFTRDSTLFYVYLPKATAITLLSYGRKSDLPRNEAGTVLRKTLMFLDDNGDARNIYGAVYAGSLEEVCLFLERYRERPISFILLDPYRLPEDLKSKMASAKLDYSEEPTPASFWRRRLCGTR
jgi:hypothetical protein